MGRIRCTAPRVVRTAVVVVAVSAALLASGCEARAASSTKLTVSGSTTVLPIAETAAEQFMHDNPGTSVLVAGIGSSAGIESVANGSSDIGTSSRDLKDPEKSLGLVDTPIAHDAIAVIVNPSNPVRALTKAQIAGIFTGRITNWAQVGGPDREIGVVNRDEASGTREAFWKIVLDGKPFDRTAAVLPGTGQVRFVVGESPGAVGYISVGFVDDTVRAIAVDGVEPSEASIVSKRYPISRVLHFFTKGKPSGLAQRYIDYVLSAAVQEGVVRDAGFLPMTGD